uniref:CCHC-type domain-containing protein n=1 Tax=Panagrolaimus davidi TaxID=227884 RepID=A0A914PBX3_9BILA
MDDLLNLEYEELDFEEDEEAQKEQRRPSALVTHSERPSCPTKSPNVGPQDSPEASPRPAKVRDVSLQESIKQLCQVSNTLLQKVNVLEKAQAPVQSVDEEVAVAMATNSFQTKAFEKQFCINTKVLALLRRPGEDSIKEAIKILSERNAVLKLADKNPQVLKLVDAREATMELEAVSSTLSKDVRELMATEVSSRKRRLFHEAGNSNTRGFTGNYQGPPFPQSRSNIQSLLDVSTQKPQGRCYYCGGYGHYANRCPRRSHQRRQYW